VNLLENYIKKVHSIINVSDRFKKYDWYDGEPMYEVVMTVDCWGNVKEYTHIFRKSEWETAVKLGYFMA
jgi:hypothetical protein